MNSYRIGIVNSFDEIREDWKRLYNLMESPSACLSLEWSELYWKYFRRAFEKLFIIVCYKDDEAVCIAPFKIHKKFQKDRLVANIITFIGDDHIQSNGFVADPAFAEDAGYAIFEYVLREFAGWDILALQGFASECAAADHYGNSIERLSKAYIVDFQSKLPVIDPKEYMENSRTASEVICAEKNGSYCFEDFALVNKEIWEREAMISGFPAFKYKNFYRELSNILGDCLRICFFYIHGEMVGYQLAIDQDSTRYVYYLKVYQKAYESEVMTEAVKSAINRNITSIVFNEAAESEAILCRTNRIIHKYSYYIGSSDSGLRDYLSRERRSRTELMQMRLKTLLNGLPLCNVSEIGWPDGNISVLILAPHFDDEILGCGGILSCHCKRNDSCSIVYFTNGDNSRFSGLNRHMLSSARKDEARKAIRHIGESALYYFDRQDGLLCADDNVVQRLAELILNGKYKRIYLPNPEDDQRDHRAAARILANVLKRIGFDGELLIYEFWNPLKTANVYFPLNYECRMRKEQAMAEHATQLMYADYVKLMSIVNTYRGKSIGKESCEFFRSITPAELMGLCSND